MSSEYLFPNNVVIRNSVLVVYMEPAGKFSYTAMREVTIGTVGTVGINEINAVRTVRT